MNPTYVESQLLLILGKGLLLSGALVVLALIFLRGRSAHTVSLYWRSALAGLIVIPVVSMWLPWLKVTRPEQKPVAQRVVAAAAPIVEGVVVIEAGPVVMTPLDDAIVTPTELASIPVGETPLLVADKPTWSERRSTLVLGIWGLGFAFVVGRWMSSWFRVRRLVRGGENGRSPKWEREIPRFGRSGQQVRLVVSEEVKCPLVFGLWRPVLLLPRDSEEWDEGKRRQVLTHELCHVRRRDPVFLLLARVAVALHWINPLVWLAAKRLRLADERTADDAVLAEGGDPAEYATLLAGFARRGLAPPKSLPMVAPSMASASTVRSRVQRILDAKQHRGAPRRTTRYVLGALVCAAVLVAGGISFSPVAAQEAAPLSSQIEESQSEFGEEGQIAVANEINMFKSKNIIIPIVEFQEATIVEAVDFLRSRSRELDTWEPDPAKKGLNFVIIGEEVANRFVPSLKLRNVPLATVVEFICQQTETSHEVGEFAITIKDAEGAAAVPVEAIEPAVVEQPVKADGGIVMAKVRRIILPVVEFEEVTLVDALKFLRQKSMERDVDEPVAAQKGVNIVLRGEDVGARKIKALKLMDVPLATVLKYVCELTNTEYKVDDFAVTIVDAADAKNDGGQLITRIFAVPPTFLADLTRAAAGGADDPFGGEAEPKKRSLVDLLRDRGIDLQQGASVSFLPAKSQLIVRATPANLDLIDQLVQDAIGDLPSMIKIRLELYEVSKADALKILKHDAGKNDGSGAYKMVEALVATNKATLLMSPTTVARPGQLAKMQTGSELSCIESYQEKDGVDAAVVRKVLIGSSFEVEPNLGVDGSVMDIRYGLYMTRGEPKTVARKVKAPVSGREVEVETVMVDTLTLSQGITTLTGQTQLLGTMRTSAKVDEPNEIMAFLTATVTKVMR